MSEEKHEVFGYFEVTCGICREIVERGEGKRPPMVE
jgi:hypothetical protein